MIIHNINQQIHNIQNFHKNKKEVNKMISMVKIIIKINQKSKYLFNKMINKLIQKWMNYRMIIQIIIQAQDNLILILIIVSLLQINSFKNK